MFIYIRTQFILLQFIYLTIHYYNIIYIFILHVYLIISCIRLIACIYLIMPCIYTYYIIILIHLIIPCISSFPIYIKLYHVYIYTHSVINITQPELLYWTKNYVIWMLHLQSVLVYLDWKTLQYSRSKHLLKEVFIFFLKKNRSYLLIFWLGITSSGIPISI